MKAMIIVALLILPSVAFANDWCKQRTVKQCDMSGTNCQLVVVCQ